MKYSGTWVLVSVVSRRSSALHFIVFSFFFGHSSLVVVVGASLGAINFSGCHLERSRIARLRAILRSRRSQSPRTLPQSSPTPAFSNSNRVFSHQRMHTASTANPALPSPAATASWQHPEQSARHGSSSSSPPEPPFQTAPDVHLPRALATFVGCRRCLST